MSATVSAGVRLPWADFARGGAILCVVYFHATLFLAEVGIGGTLGRAKLALELFPLPAFFLLTGVFSARIILTGTFRELATHRLIPIAYVYVLWSAIRFCLFALFPTLPSRDTDIAAADPMSLVLLPVLPASLYWFLYALIVFTLTVWLLRRVPRGIVLVAAAALSTLVTTGTLETGTIAWDRIGALFVFFVLGVAGAGRIRSAMERARLSHAVLAVVTYIAVVGVLFIVRGASRLPLVVLAGQCFAVAAALLVSKQLARLRPLSFVSAVGRLSLPVYLVHILVIPPLAFAVGSLSPSWPAMANVVVAVAVTAVAVLVGVGVARIARFAPWLLAPKRSRREAETVAE